jgi:hypothetical protein
MATTVHSLSGQTALWRSCNLMYWTLEYYEPTVIDMWGSPNYSSTQRGPREGWGRDKAHPAKMAPIMASPSWQGNMWQANKTDHYPNMYTWDPYSLPSQTSSNGGCSWPTAAGLAYQFNHPKPSIWRHSIWLPVQCQGGNTIKTHAKGFTTQPTSAERQ